VTRQVAVGHSLLLLIAMLFLLLWTVKALKGTKSTNPNQCPGLVLSSYRTGLLRPELDGFPVLVPQENYYCYYHYHYTRLMAFFRGQPG